MLNKIKVYMKDPEFNHVLLKLPTPHYIYNLNIMNLLVEEITNNIKGYDYIKLGYAMKANPNPEILNFLKDKVSFIDVASIQEFQIASPYFKNISINGPSFSTEELLYLLKIKENSITIDYNSLSQLYAVKEHIRDKNIGVRINIPYHLKNGEYIKSRFGIHIDNENLYDFIAENNNKIVRLHFHNGEKIDDFFRLIRSILDTLKSKGLLNDIQEINIGGGISNYLEKNKVKDLINQINNLKNEYFKYNDVIFSIEPGHSLTFLSGFLVTSVISSDIFKEINIIHTNCSCYNNFRWFRPKIISHTSNSTNAIITNIYGTTCFEDDIFVENKYLPLLKIEDKMIFYPTGAYSVSNSTNLHHLPTPKESFFYNEELDYELNRD